MYISEPINVWVFFKNSYIQPFMFFWRERQIKVDTVNLMHTTKHGNKTYYHFSISGNGNFYRLRFDSTDLKWFLEEVEEN